MSPGSFGMHESANYIITLPLSHPRPQVLDPARNFIYHQLRKRLPRILRWVDELGYAFVKLVGRVAAVSTVTAKSAGDFSSLYIRSEVRLRFSSTSTTAPPMSGCGCSLSITQPPVL